MKYTKPEYSRGQVDKAGDVLRAAVNLSTDEATRALSIMSNWRSSHAFPLNTVTVSLKKVARNVDPAALVAQRLKRIPSIIDKLDRERSMSLARMQDIGGCRSVVNGITETRRLVESLKASRMKHILRREVDYIANPKESGYRGIHLIYRYNSDRNEIYNKLQVEVQIRSAVQHAWATAVETMGTFLKSSLKASQGPDDWLEFFKHASSAFAILEGTPKLHSNLDDSDVIALVEKQARALRVRARLQNYGKALRMVEQHPDPEAKYFLMLLEPKKKELTIKGFRSSELAEATSRYSQLERRFPTSSGSEVVLVAAESISSLRQAYPNYFLDTNVFLKLLDQSMSLRRNPSKLNPKQGRLF
ncbi:RelA/SpoT domain-containing protein [Stenotrophomonas maltophilia]|uniref:RelA/SpoT domain-containing protein n=1 Tax=Stenotrophomonas maltophilia TaxID=40324 RepID=UPI0040411CDB